MHATWTHVSTPIFDDKIYTSISGESTADEANFEYKLEVTSMYPTRKILDN